MNRYLSKAIIYLAIITSFKVQFCSFGILARDPPFVIYFLAFSPLMDIFFGNRPINSIIWARWSSFLPNWSLVSFLGLNKSSPVKSSNVMQAKDHISAERLYFDPNRTSGLLYCLVWISVAKWWCSQQAFPKSAILTLNPSVNPPSTLSNDILCLWFPNSYWTAFLGLGFIFLYFINLLFCSSFSLLWFEMVSNYFYRSSSSFLIFFFKVFLQFLEMFSLLIF